MLSNKPGSGSAPLGFFGLLYDVPFQIFSPDSP
jgi:hypothetical protein